MRPLMTILNGEWRAFIRVDDLQKGLAFYGDLLGLPVAQYMEGSVVVGAVKPSFLAEHPLRVVD